MSNFPMDLIVDILSRLPVKPLLRFRCVSKPWCALIDDPDFIKLHLNRSINTKSHLSLILNDSSLSSVNFDSLDNATKLNPPLKWSDYGTEVLGSCNGLICLYNGEEDVCIWNPSTQKHRKLSVNKPDKSPFFFTTYQNIIYGFGYDFVTDDYKLMRTTQYRGKNWDLFESEVSVYSLKSNSWRRIQDFPYDLRHCFWHGVFVGGALHWVVSRNYESDSVNFLVAAFDLTNEEYRLVPQPEFSDEDFYICVGELDGCLCIFCDYDQVRFEVWVMKDYGVKESWSKLFSIAEPQGIRLFDSVTPVAYSKSGGEVLLVQDNDNLIWFDLEHKTVKNINIHGLPDLFVTYMCVESLVPLKGEGETREEAEQTRRRTKRRIGRRESQGVIKVVLVGTDYTSDMLLTQSAFAHHYNLIPCCHENRTASTRTIRSGGLPPGIDFHGAKNINFRIANRVESFVPVALIDVQFGDFVVHDA